MKSKRQALGVGLITALALVGGLAVATNVIGKKQQRTVINDKAGDGGGFVPRKRPGFCDIVQATSELAEEGRLRHTVTTRGRVRRKYNAPPVVITRQRVRGSIGLASFVLSPGEPKVWSHLRNHRRTIVYFVKREVIRNAVDRRDKYFWVADQCQLHDDKAPDRGSATQPLKNRHRRHR
jgi:hypothetical protein